MRPAWLPVLGAVRKSEKAKGPCCRTALLATRLQFIKLKSVSSLFAACAEPDLFHCQETLRQ